MAGPIEKCKVRKNVYVKFRMYLHKWAFNLNGILPK
jgi:hypothetical protein